MASSAFQLLCVSVLLSAFLAPTLTQVVIGSSPSFPGADLPKQSATSWPSLPPRGRSDVPIRFLGRNGATVPNVAGRPAGATGPPSTASALSARNLSSGPVPTRPAASRPRTDTASLAALSRALAGRDVPTKASAPPPWPTFPSSPEPAAENPPTDDDDPQGLGSGGAPTPSEELAQYQQQAQTAVSEEPLGKTATTGSARPPPTEPRATLTPVVTQATPQAVLTGELTAITPPTKRDAPPKQDSTSPQTTTITTTTTTTTTTDKPPQTPGAPSNEQSRSSSDSAVDATAAGSLAKATSQPNRTAQLGVSGSPRSGISMFFTTGIVPVTKPRFGPTYHPISQRNRSVLLGHPHQAPHSTFDPSLAPTADSTPNGTLLYWGDLSRTLAFAWELHVYGSASLFLLLFAGAALGLTLSPATSCPHRGALALANALLFLAGGLRAALFLIDPYGTRKLLPRPAVAALYNLPLHLLVWAQAAVALLSMRASGVGILPPTLERPPLAAALAVLQCTLLLAADLLSPALSPVVPVTLQVLSMCWGLGICLGFLCYVFPRLRRPPIPRPGAPPPPDGPGSKAWGGCRRTGVVLGRVLAVCSVLGALCCGLHLHPTLWLYGLLGDWTRFNWGWWLVHFWARLLELAWGFSLLLLSSWLFWRPRGREEGGAGDARAAGELPSPGQSTASSHRHTCWSKIVQSLRGKPCRKSESNGVGGGGGGGASGEVPNNWAGQERPGADISKSLIRNQNHEQAGATQPPLCAKENNRVRNHRGQSAERGVPDGPSGSLLRLQALGRPPQRSLSGSLDQERDASVSLYDFDLRPPSPIDLTRSIDEALHREHLLGAGSLFHPEVPSPGSGLSQGPWLRRNSDPQLSESSEAPTESSMPLGGSVLSSVPSRQVTAPPTPSHQGHRWAGGAAGSVPSSVSCPVSLRPSRTSTGQLADDGVDDTRPFITPDSERVRGRSGRPVGSRSYLEVSRHDDSASVSSEIIDL